MNKYSFQVFRSQRSAPTDRGGSESLDQQSHLPEEQQLLLRPQPHSSSALSTFQVAPAIRDPLTGGSSFSGGSNGESAAELGEAGAPIARLESLDEMGSQVLTTTFI